MLPLTKELDILLLEDNPYDVELLERELRKSKLKFSIRVADSRDGFVNELTAAQPDVILSDHSLPTINSIEAMEIASRDNSDVPFILVTGSVSEEFAVECMKAGADDYILKTSLMRLPSSIQNLFSKREINREKEIIEALHRKLQEAYTEVEENHKKIIDSITYAKRIQEALLPSQENFSRCFPNAFIINKPKDIVSGDFYWVVEKEDLHFIAVVDCTGHGVPGALMSMLGFNLLTWIINLQNITHPDEILMNMHESIQRMLKQGEKGYRSHDGMDISLCCIDTVKNKMEFAGGNQILYHYSGGGMKIIKGNKCGIGGAYAQSVRPFTRHELTFEKGDTIYLSTDGYSDQFGEKENRKMGRNSLIEFLSTLQQADMKEQGKKLQLKLEEWQGDLIQTDDILLVGIEL